MFNLSLNLHFLETFNQIIKFGSFSKTAQNLNLSQSAISQQMDVLEKFFGAKLFERSIKGVHLTEQGKILKKYSESMLDSLNLAKIEITKSLGELKGKIRISSSTIPGEHILPKYMLLFKKKNPTIDFEIEVNDTQISLNKLRAGLIDLAAVGSLEDPAVFDTIVLAQEELLLVVPHDHELAQTGIQDVKQILKYPFIFREKTSGTRRESEKILKQLGISIEDLQIIGELNTTESVLTAISEGLGISIVSSIATSKLEKTGAVKGLNFPNTSTKRKLYLVKKKVKEENPLVKTFWNFISHTIISYVATPEPSQR